MVYVKLVLADRFNYDYVVVVINFIYADGSIITFGHSQYLDK